MNDNKIINKIKQKIAFENFKKERKKSRRIKTEFLLGATAIVVGASIIGYNSCKEKTL